MNFESLKHLEHEHVMQHCMFRSGDRSWSRQSFSYDLQGNEYIDMTKWNWR